MLETKQIEKRTFFSFSLSRSGLQKAMDELYVANGAQNLSRTILTMLGYYKQYLNPFPNKPWFLCVCSTSLLKTVGKGEIALNEQFLLFPQSFLPV